MSLIKVLPETLVNQIAAGEVVERPSSVLKELVDNSIDAGADSITIEIKDGGKGFIKVIDNGCGMSRVDVELSLQRHATSKIKKENDLWNITTMGFRGEALASIASVSKMTLRSKREEDLAGTEINLEGGELINLSEVGMGKGTRVEVYNLFFNTPARLKYLKKDSTELSHITSILNSLALANSDVSFKLIHNGKVISDLPKVTDLRSRISDIYGKATAEAMIPLFYGGTSFQIDGFVGKPVISRSSSKYQYFFVNGRPIQHFVLANSIRSAFHSLLMENKKPVFMINIKIDPALIDVNVHPRKVEIRFEDQQALIKVMYSCVKSALEKNVLIPKGFTESRSYMGDKFPEKGAGGISQGGLSVGPGSDGRSVGPGSDGRSVGPGSDGRSVGPGSDGRSVGPGSDGRLGQATGKSNDWNDRRLPRKSDYGVQDAMTFSKNMMDDRDHAELSDDSKMQAITQVSNSYIIAKNEEGLVLIDQHAAHERVRYEQLMDQFEKQEKSIQPLLAPHGIDFASDEKLIFEEESQIFVDLGFEIEPFGGDSFVVQGVPSFLVEEDIDNVIRGVLDDISNEKAPTKMQGKTEVIINYMACRSAIKFGQKLNLPEMQSLISQMEKLNRPYTCPHGRPTMVSLSLDELEKMFGRK